MSRKDMANMFWATSTESGVGRNVTTHGSLPARKPTSASRRVTMTSHGCAVSWCAIR